MKKLHAFYSTLMVRLLALMATFMVAPQALAIDKIDLTDDSIGGGQDFDDIASNIDGAAQSGAALIIQLVTLGGFVVVAMSLYQLYKASKDEREKPGSAIMGLFIGGAMAAVGSIMWIMKRTVIGA